MQLNTLNLRFALMVSGEGIRLINGYFHYVQITPGAAGIDKSGSVVWPTTAWPRHDRLQLIAVTRVMLLYFLRSVSGHSTIPIPCTKISPLHCFGNHAPGNTRQTEAAKSHAAYISAFPVLQTVVDYTTEPWTGRCRRSDVPEVLHRVALM